MQAVDQLKPFHGDVAVLHFDKTTDIPKPAATLSMLRSWRCRLRTPFQHPSLIGRSALLDENLLDNGLTSPRSLRLLDHSE